MRIGVGGAVGMALVVACGGSAPSTGNGVPDHPDESGRNAKVTLTITVSGRGSVTAAAQSIACAATCAEPLAAGTPLQLGASPAAGMRFTGWSGACSGTGGCALTLTQDMPVGAHFEQEEKDACAGLMPKLPPAKTFVSPGDRIDGHCNGATTDGVGTVYNLGYGHGGIIYSSAGAIVGGENLFVPLASGFSAFTRAMILTNPLSAFAPDGTLVTTTPRYTPIAVGEQANGGSVIVSVPPGCTNATDLEMVRFDDHFATTSDVHVLNRGCAPSYDHAASVLVDARDRTLIVYLARPDDLFGIGGGHFAARWFDASGNALTDWFDAGSGTGTGYGDTSIVPLIGGGAALLSASGWATIPSGAARIGPAPAGFTPGKNARIVLGGRAYAMREFETFSPNEMPPTVEIVEPGGKSCGVLATAPAPYEYFSIGKDGTLLTVANTVGASGRLDMCTTTYYPRVLE